MANLSILGDKSTMLCTFLVPRRQIVRLGLGLVFFVLFFMVRVRVRARVIIAWYVCIFYEKSHYFTSFTLYNLTVRPGYNVRL